jgi:membrane fusion protein, multidrug efflux system
MEEARDAFERSGQLYESDAISHAEYLTTKRNFEQAESDVELLKLQVEFGEIRAPVDAVVTARLVEVGNNVSVNERMFTIAEHGMLVMRPGVSELNLIGLEEGQPVEVYIDVYPEYTLSGRIRRIFPRADVATRLFTVEVQLLPDELSPVIRQGYLARVRFAADDRRQVVTVPSEAIIRQDGETYVFILNDGEDTVLLRHVEVGVQRDGYAEIRSGIDAGTKVAAANLESLKDGTPVRIVGIFRRHGFRN